LLAPDAVDLAEEGGTTQLPARFKFEKRNVLKRHFNQAKQCPDDRAPAAGPQIPPASARPGGSVRTLSDSGTLLVSFLQDLQQ